MTESQPLVARAVSSGRRAVGCQLVVSESVKYARVVLAGAGAGQWQGGKGDFARSGTGFRVPRSLICVPRALIKLSRAHEPCAAAGVVRAR